MLKGDSAVEGCSGNDCPPPSSAGATSRSSVRERGEPSLCGATVTAISEETARAAGVDRNPDLVPVVLRTANGLAQAKTGTVDRLRVGNITARDLKVVISPALGNMDVLGMNFLSELASWRVEGRTLVMVPQEAGSKA